MFSPNILAFIVVSRWFKNLVCIAVCVVIATSAGSLSRAQQIDPHQVYEEKCGMCHTAHASDFVYDKLDWSDDMLQGLSSGRPVKDMLEAGHGKLSPDEIEILMELLHSIQSSDPVFKTKCDICHDRAVDLARLKLIMRDGVLFGRYTDREIEPFLKDHGRLDPEEVGPMVEMLIQQLDWKASP